jgi:hypothetical protein
MSLSLQGTDSAKGSPVSLREFLSASFCFVASRGDAPGDYSPTAPLHVQKAQCWVSPPTALPQGSVESEKEIFMALIMTWAPRCALYASLRALFNVNTLNFSGPMNLQSVSACPGSMTLLCR